MAVQVSTKPILFSSSMIRAILEGRKNQTRRIVKLPSWSTKDWSDFELDGNEAQIICANTGCLATILCPYGKVGDRLYVRETWAKHSKSCTDLPKIFYRADEDTDPDIYLYPLQVEWKPSIHMPRAISRITLELTDIRVQRLQDISEEDAIAEGVPPFNWDDGESLRPIPAFAKLWDSINHETHPWKSNSWVWAVSFKRILGGVQQCR